MLIRIKSSPESILCVTMISQGHDSKCPTFCWVMIVRGHPPHLRPPSPSRFFTPPPCSLSLSLHYSDLALYHHIGDERPNDKKMWYNLLTQSESNINDLIHYWRQFYLNWPVLTGDLQHLTKVAAPTNDQPPTDKYVSSLVEFKKKHPVLFECLYAVFWAMMSNSRLCKQIHGMMRHGLNPNIGMDEANHHRQCSSSTNYEMNEARRVLGDASGKSREEQKNAVKRSKTK